MISTSQLVAMVLAVTWCCCYAQAESCQQGVNCRLPGCFCPVFQHPLAARDIPQIVYFGFDDAVQPVVSYLTITFSAHQRPLLGWTYRNSEKKLIKTPFWVFDGFHIDIVRRYYSDEKKQIFLSVLFSMTSFPRWPLLNPVNLIWFNF